MAVEALPHGQKGKTEPPGTWGHIIASNPREQAQGVGRPDEKGEEKPGVLFCLAHARILALKLSLQVCYKPC